MISASPAYKAAIVADARRMVLRAVVDIIDPDLAWVDGIPSSGAAWPSRPEQIHDKVFQTDRYASLEPRRWLLDDSFAILPPDKKEIPGQIGFWGSQLIVSGNNTASSRTETVNNPFLRTKAQALTAARQILAASGGSRLETVGRGDPAGEIGDVDVIWLDRSSAASARRIQQDFDFSSGVLKGCGSVLLQADGAFLYQQRQVLTQSGNFTAPAGVSKLRLILAGGGQDGTGGTPGTWNEAGTDGEDGQGGKVWSDTIPCNPGQVFQVTIGQGAAHGQPGGNTTFGPYSSANGAYYPAGYTDIASGQTYARAGVPEPLPGSGDGGAGGKGGIQGQEHTEEDNITGTVLTWYVIDNFPGPGEPGATGQSGCAVIFYESASADGHITQLGG